MISQLLFEKLQFYCEYQERSERDVRQKCRTLKIDKSDVDAYVEKLKAENFLNEKRFVSGFIYSKHTYKKWGAQKIKAGLAAKGISAAASKELLTELAEDEVLENAITAAQRKWKSIKGETLRDRKNKLIRFLIGRGFERDVIKTTVEKVAAD
ncbi:MAG: regulatory protein RecX [Chitinophagales bacterium]